MTQKGRGMQRRSRWALLGATITPTWGLVAYSAATGWPATAYQATLGIAVATTAAMTAATAIHETGHRNRRYYQHELDLLRTAFADLREHTIASGIAAKYGAQTDAAVRIPEPADEPELAPVHHIHERRISISGDNAIAGIEAGHHLDEQAIGDAIDRRSS